MTNPNKVLFTSMAWDEVNQLLYISDELGYIFVANVYDNAKYTIQKQVCKSKIKKINIYDDGINRTLFVFTERGMKAFKIKIGQQT